MDESIDRYFAALTHDREENARILSKRSMRGFWNSVVEKYSEQAHFVYELLQNADDARATRARFILKNDELIFAHNGTRHFTLTDPAREDEDTNAGKLGDVNAITSIANSTKSDEATIGKFGVGFKAVFQYTQTPHIYGPELSFRIENYIVPRPINQDHDERRSDETLFVFPFNKREMPKEIAVKEISERLSLLDYPTLFLRYLSEVRFTTPASTGSYSKECVNAQLHDGIVAQHLRLASSLNEDSSHDDLWLLSATGSDGLTCSAGFFLNKDGGLKPIRRNAYCFFPTKVNTGLNFVVNAPFLLTDSREGIRTGDQHNINMVGRIAELSAKALVILRDIGESSGKRILDDRMFDVVPYDWHQDVRSTHNSIFIDEKNEEQFTFDTICQAMFEVMEEERLLPSESGYCYAYDAYIAETGQIAELFNEQRFQTLVDDQTAGWIFSSTSFRAMPYGLRSHLRYLGTTTVDESFLIREIDGRFVESQSLKWLSELHAFLSETTNRVGHAKTMPVFVDSEGRSTAAFDSVGNEILFLPADGADDCRTIEPESLRLDGTAKLVELLGLKQPSLMARVTNRILPSYSSGRDPRDVEAFKAILKCYVDSGKSHSFLENTSQYPFLACVTTNGPKQSGTKPNDAYMPNEQLTKYFAYKTDALFVDLDFYRRMIPNDSLRRQFLEGLGINTEAKLVTKRIWPGQESLLKGHSWAYCSQNQSESWREQELDGCNECLSRILTADDKEQSLVLWSTLVGFFEHNCVNRDPSDCFYGVHKYFYYSPGTERYDPTMVLKLRSHKWLVNREGEFASPKELDDEQLSIRYDHTSSAARRLIEFLGFRERVDGQSEGVTEPSEREVWADNIDEMTRDACGKSLDELLRDPYEKALYIEYLKSRRPHDEHLYQDSDPVAMTNVDGIRPEYIDASDETANDSTDQNQSTSGYSDAEEDYEEAAAEKGSGAKKDKKPVKVRNHLRSLPGEQGLEEVTDDIVERVAKRRNSRQQSSIKKGAKRSSNMRRDAAPKESRPPEETPDDDILTPAVIDYEQRAERRKERCAQEIDNIEREEYLRNSAIAADTYSFKWFRSLIELESLLDDASSGRSEFTISFGRVNLEEGSNRTLILEQPTRAIPPSVEDLSNIPLSLQIDDYTTRIEIEVASVRNHTLRARLKDGADVSGVNLANVVEARIEVRNPTFLLAELRKRFDGLNLKDDYNMRDNLPENIEFVFGPPGTGKTTHLAREVLIPLMRKTENLKVLVLAPTNKAADVLTRKVIECTGNVNDCVDWLTRFGITEDTFLEESGIYRDKTYDYSNLKRSVTITTIARFPYDYFMTAEGHQPIRNMEWDYVVFDEASMISCAQITYPLFKARPRKFIIAGDPHQIAPVLRVDLWQDENIYTMVKLDSFKEPHTIPHDYKVTLLTTQYRSVPAIGRTFSELSYDGLLNSYRSEEGVDRSYLGTELARNPINVITFPVSPYESVYRPKQLNRKSSYQPYSALLAFELVNDIAKRAGALESERDISIGIVSPYRAQAELLSGLISELALPANVSVQAGTIHGFQGDECDVMIVVLNTPPSISSGSKIFLNRRNILNVSISRARDCLILLVPDSETKNRDRLREVNRLEQICSRTHAMGEHTSRAIEEIVLGSPTYIEDNCFTTGHQSVNVYGRPDQKYEIRSEGHAVDIQLHQASTDDGRSSQGRETEPPSTQTRPEKPAAATKADVKVSKSIANMPEPRNESDGNWSQEEIRLLKSKYGMYSNLPGSLYLLLPGRELKEIDRKAVELGIISTMPYRNL